MSALLTVKGLTVTYVHNHIENAAVRSVSLELKRGETLGVVGESGCGKSTLALSLMGLLPKEESRIASGEITFDGQTLIDLSDEQWRNIRGKRVAMIFQDPFSSLNPVLPINYQLQEAIALDEGAPNPAKALDLLKKVQLPDPERMLNSYPHQLSGGQRQRIMIAMALSRSPDLLIADEPTTALDVTVQDEIVNLLLDLQKETKMAMIFVTHNMGLVKDVADNLAVMYAGQIIENGKTKDLLKNPAHPYTEGLLACLPKLKANQTTIPVLDGQPPDIKALPKGCPFHPRCGKILEVCDKEDPVTRQTKGRSVRCHLY